MYDLLRMPFKVYPVPCFINFLPECMGKWYSEVENMDILLKQLSELARLSLLDHNLLTIYKASVPKETAFLVRIFHVFQWTCSNLEHGITRKAG